MRMNFNELFPPNLNKIVTKPNPSDRELEMLFDAINRDLEKLAIINGISFFNKLPEPEEKAMDCWQDTLLNMTNVIKNGAVFNDYEHFKGYILKVNKNILRQEFNKINKKNIETVNFSDSIGNIDTDFDIEEELDGYDKKIDELNGISKEYKELLKLRLIDRLPYKIIEKELNINANLLRKRFERVFNKIISNNNIED